MFSIPRVTIALVTGLVVALLSGPVALAGQQGSIGNILWTDDSTHAGAVCKYPEFAAGKTKTWLSKITVKPPSVWWPNRDSNKSNEHGTVGWRFIVQYNNGTWHKYAASSIQKATAYEDYPTLYDPQKDAPFTKMTMSINSKPYGNVQWRVVVKAFWYYSGSTAWITHTDGWYAAKLGTASIAAANEPCSAYIQMF